LYGVYVVSSSNVKPPRVSTSAAFQLLDEARKNLESVRYKIVVLSGKGGVGKTFISSMTALAVAEKGYSVGLFDADIHGSSIPTIYGMHGSRLYADEEGIIPATGPLGVKVVATNLLLDKPETPIVWRGPLKSRAIIELLAHVKWGSLDYLFIDLPPGTGDEAITIAQVVSGLKAIVVTAPSVLSETIVAKAIEFLRHIGVDVIGIVENMSYFKCPSCGRVYNLLGRSTGEQLASKYGARLLARIPLDPLIGEAIDKGIPYLLGYPDGEAAKAIRELASIVIEAVSSGNQ